MVQASRHCSVVDLFLDWWSETKCCRAYEVEFSLSNFVFHTLWMKISLPHKLTHYSDVIMSAMAPLITGVSIVYSTVCWGTDQRKHQGSTLLAFVRGIHRWPVNSPYKWPTTRKMFPFGDVIMSTQRAHCIGDAWNAPNNTSHPEVCTLFVRYYIVFVLMVYLVWKRWRAAWSF